MFLGCRRKQSTKLKLTQAQGEHVQFIERKPRPGFEPCWPCSYKATFLTTTPPYSRRIKTCKKNQSVFPSFFAVILTHPTRFGESCQLSHLNILWKKYTHLKIHWIWCCIKNIHTRSHKNRCAVKTWRFRQPAHFTLQITLRTVFMTPKIIKDPSPCSNIYIHSTNYDFPLFRNRGKIWDHWHHKKQIWLLVYFQ